MIEQFTAHIIFHPCSHHMPLDINEQIAQPINDHQHHHQRRHENELVERTRPLLAKDIFGDVTDTEWDNEDSRGNHTGAGHIRDEQTEIGAVIGQEFSGA